MKCYRNSLLLALLIILHSCNHAEQKTGIADTRAARKALEARIPVDKGFGEYIAGYTSGIIAAASPVEIKFTPAFASIADKNAKGLFEFDPAINGRTEWKDDQTLVFTPAKPLEPGTLYTGRLHLERLGKVDDRLTEFPLRIQTLKKDFRVTAGSPESLEDGSGYSLEGQVSTPDITEADEIEKYIEVRLGRKKQEISWEHSSLTHIFTLSNIPRTDEEQELTISWDGNQYGAKQKGSSTIMIPKRDDFMVLDVFSTSSPDQRIDIVFSDRIDAEQDLTGMIHFSQDIESIISSQANIITILPANSLEGEVEIIVDPALRNSTGKIFGKQYSRQLDFSQVLPGIMPEGNGVILPSSKDLIFPFKAANLNAVDLQIVKVFENNIPWFLQQGDITDVYSMKRFGRPVYSGKIDLVNTPGMVRNGWNLYTIDLADYIDIEPGVIYKVTLSMRRSYSTYPCVGTTDESAFEQLLDEAGEKMKEAWDNPDVYYEDPLDEIYYSFGFDWDDRDNPCKEAYYSPDRRQSRNVLASNIGLIAKKGDDNILHVFANDLITALPLNEAAIDIYDYQLQKIVSGNTNQEGSVSLACERTPFLVVASKDKDRNYLKTNEGSSLSLSSFDVSGTSTEKGIKAFIYGERDVWRPGDSIFISVFIKDMKNSLPADHPVQFELINPMDQKVDNQVRKLSGSNLLVFRTVTQDDAVTGNYRAVIRIGGATFTRRIRIETVKPNRLKIELGFDRDILGGDQSSAKGSLKVKWLNGSVAGNLNSSVEYILKQTVTKFDKYQQYTFDDPVTEFHPETVSIFNGKLDESGDASIVFAPRDIVAPGMLNVIFTAKTMEPGGDESITQASFRYAPYKVFAGINFPALKGKDRMLFTDADNNLKIVTVDASGKPVDSDVEISIHKLNYRWWWESDQENLGYYISNNIYKPVLTKNIRTSGGEASFTFRIDKEEWGRYLVRATTPDGHSTGKILLIDWPWDYGMKGNTSGATLLSVSTDKEKYNPGDEISLTFPSPDNCRAIVTLENSSGVMEEIRTATGTGNTVVKFRARPEMSPNIYAYVTIIQPHAQTINDMPVRLYGIVPVMVEDPATKLTPRIEMADELRSGKPFVVEVSEKDGKQMNYTLAIVDEGLLDLTGFRTPDPREYFYAREALGVQTWDLYDNVLGAFGGTLGRIMAIGGDELLQDESANKAQRFIPIVKFLGPFNLASGKTNSHTVTLPQYTGSVRTMVIAGTDKAFGFAEKPVFVRDPLMVLATAPRVVSPGEKVSLPVTLFVQKEGIKEVSLDVSGENVTFIEKNRRIPVSNRGEFDTGFTFTAGDKAGIAKISVTASGGGENASHVIELDIRNPNPPETRSEVKILGKGEKWQTAFTPYGTPGSNSAVLEVSSLPSINLEKRLDWLINYPHGCSEQTTSAAFPQLYLKNLRNNDPATLKRISDNIRQAVSVIAARQMADGGVAMWPGAMQADNWITSYTGHFMLEAEKNGYSVPAAFRQKWLNYQERLARDWRYDKRYVYTMNDQAYRLFTLALAGKPERGAMNRLREAADQPQLSRWLLSAAFALSGRPEAATGLLDVRNTSTEQQYQGHYYGSEMRDKAIVLFTLAILKNEEQALPVLKEICDRFNNSSWFSTHDVAWGLMAYMEYMETMPAGKDSEIKVIVTLNGQKSDITVAAGKLAKTDLKITDAKNSMTVENTSDRAIYITRTLKGLPSSADATEARKGLSLDISYYDLQMNSIDHRNLLQGTDFLMVVKVRNETYTTVDNLALTQMVPSGWEIRNTRLFEAKYGIKESAFEYRDFRDDRVNTYFSLQRGETRTFVAVMNAAYAGEFFQPSIWCEAMYTPDCYARIPGTSVKVFQADSE